MQKAFKINKWIDLDYINSLKNENRIKNNLLVDFHQPLLKNKLISIRQPIIQKPLNLWAKELNASIQELATQKQKSKKIEKISFIFQQAVFIFCAMNNTKYAREICYTQIQAYIYYYYKFRDLDLLKNAFAPWINLIRIDRKEGNICDAISKINTLNAVNLALYSTSENKNLTKILHQALNYDTKTHLEITSKIIVEKIKLYLATHQYLKLIEYIEENKIYIDDSYQTSIKETRVIAYANTGRIDQLYHFLSYENKLSACHVLKLRECEIQAMLYKNNHPIDMTRMQSLILSIMIKSNEMKINQIIFSLHLIEILQIVNLSEMALCVANHCLQSSLKINDEVLIAESLISLYSLVIDSQQKTNIENLMVTHYFNTQYAMTRQKMKNCFQELRHVETYNDQNEMIILYENLLAFNFDS